MDEQQLKAQIKNLYKILARISNTADELKPAVEVSDLPREADSFLWDLTELCSRHENISMLD